MNQSPQHNSSATLDEIGSTKNKPYDLIIVGGGITGLAAAFFAGRAGKRVLVLEASSSTGGLLNTFEIGGNRLERFYHHFFTHDVELLWLLSELGLQDQVEFHDSKMGTFRKGKHYSFGTLTDLLRFDPLSILSKLRFAASSIYLGSVADWKKAEQQSAISWLKRFAGKEVVEQLWRPLMEIKFGNKADEVPLSWLIGRMRQRMQSRTSGKEKLGYLKGSLQILLNALLKELTAMGVRIETDCPVKELISTRSSVEGVRIKGAEYCSKQVLLTVPSPITGQLIEPINLEFGKRYVEQQYFGAICCIVETSRKLSDSYWMNIADPGYPFGGIIEQTNLIDSDLYQGKHISYLSRYFTHDETIAKQSEAETKLQMIKGLKGIFPDLTDREIERIHLFKARFAAPVCTLSFSKQILPVQTQIDNLFAVNMTHVYPDERSANNSIRIALEACKLMKIATPSLPESNSLAAKIGFDQL